MQHHPGHSPEVISSARGRWGKVQLFEPNLLQQTAAAILAARKKGVVRERQELKKHFKQLLAARVFRFHKWRMKSKSSRCPQGRVPGAAEDQ